MEWEAGAAVCTAAGCTVGAADSSARIRSKVEVRRSGETCRALASAEMTCCGSSFTILLGISSRGSLRRCRASCGTVPVRAKNNDAAKPYTSVASLGAKSITYCSMAAHPGTRSGGRSVSIRRTA